MPRKTHAQIRQETAEYVLNAVSRRSLQTIYPGFFEGAKHNHYKDFGYPETVTFDLAYSMYSRNSVARGAIQAEALKVWEEYPQLLETEASDDETPLERDIRLRFRRLRFWQKIKEIDTRSTVGAYSGCILRLADGLNWNEETGRVNGLDGLVDIIPAWQGQLKVSEWDDDPYSETYAEPKMFEFNENAVGENAPNRRQLIIHPSRVIIWSEDGTVHGQSSLQSGYNDIIDIEKVKGAGAEGFWKNSKRDPVLNLDKEVKPEEMARAMNVSVAELKTAISDRVEDWQTGLDKMLAFQGIDVKTLPVTQISPEHFLAGPLSCFAASRRMPLKILIGTQTGERASTEDEKQWNRTCQSYRVNRVEPNLDLLIERLEQVGVLPQRDWNLEWTELVGSSPEDKLARAEKMADVNVKMKDTGEIVFTHEEIRAETGRDPLSPSEAMLDDYDEAAEAAALSIVDDKAA